MALESELDALDRGDAAPDFELPGTDGETYSLADFADHRALLVVFTCNHCPYAQAKFEGLNHLSESYNEVAVVGINPNDAEEYPDDSFEEMQRLVDEGEVRYDAYLRDESQDVARAYGAVCTPDPFLFERQSPEGAADPEFRLVYHGRLDDALNPDEMPTDREMRDVIERLLNGEEIDDEFKPSQGCSIKWKDD